MKIEAYLYPYGPGILGNIQFYSPGVGAHSVLLMYARAPQKLRVGVSFSPIHCRTNSHVVFRQDGKAPPKAYEFAPDICHALTPPRKRSRLKLCVVVTL